MPSNAVHAPNSTIKKKQLPEKVVSELLAHIGEISTLPTVALRIVDLASDPETGAADLLEAVRSDPALAMRLMRTINSSYYAVNEKVADLQQAITLLGFQEVRNLALTAYIARLFKQSDVSDDTLRNGLWNHMVGTAMVARLLAELCGQVSPQEAYLGGLLHDVGMILMDQYLHDAFGRTVAALDEQKEICELEQSVFSFDHTDLGAHVAEQWSLPEKLVAAIGNHHTPNEYDGPHRMMVYLVALANYFCNLKGLTSLGVRPEEPPPLELFSKMGIRKDLIGTILERLDDVLKSANLMANVQVR